MTLREETEQRERETLSSRAYLAEQTETLAAPDFQQALTISTASAWGTWLLLFALALRAVKKSSGKKQLRGV